MQLGRRAEAIQDCDRAIDLAQGQGREVFQLPRAAALAQRGEHARATAEIEALINKAPFSGRTLYKAACVYAVSTTAVSRDTQLIAIEQDTKGQKYAARAIELLMKAQAAGYFNEVAIVEHMKQDHDLDPLRSRADFQKLLAKLEHNR